MEEIERTLDKCLVVPAEYNTYLNSETCNKKLSCDGSIVIDILTCPKLLAYELRCIPRPPEICKRIENPRECYSFEEGFGCSLALAKRCPQECKNYTECHCRPSPKSCPPGLKLARVDCDMSEEQIRSNPICAEERCPKSYDGIRKLNQCQLEVHGGISVMGWGEGGITDVQSLGLSLQRFEARLSFVVLLPF